MPEYLCFCEARGVLRKCIWWTRLARRCSTVFGTECATHIKCRRGALRSTGADKIRTKSGRKAAVLSMVLALFFIVALIVGAVFCVVVLYQTMG